jgi:glycosyltransferase involved in cell wall biosynthesis
VRVLLTVPSLAREFGGPTAKAVDLAEALRTRAADVRLVGAGESDESGVVALGEFTRFHATPVPRRTSVLRRLVRGADVVHVLGFRDPIGTLAAREAGRAGVPYVLEPSGMVRRRLRSNRLKRGFDGTLGRMVIGGAAAVIAASPLEAAELREAGLAGERIRVLPNGVRFQGLLPLPERGAFRRALGVREDAPLSLTIARIGAVKGLPTLVRAAALLPDLHVAIAGPDEHDGTLDALRAAMAAPDLKHRVRILSRGVWGEAKRRALADADVFCLPSDYESFGTALVEAAGCGLPVVTTSGCGIAPALDRSSTRVVSPGDVHALAEAIREVLGSAAIPEAALRSAPVLRERLDWRTLIDEQLEIYRNVRRA